MSSIPEISLAEQRLELRQKMAEQRQHISHLVDPDSGAEANNQFPRSMTMRLITQHPAGTLQVVSKIALLLLGTRTIRSLSTVLMVSKIVRSIAFDHGKSVSTERKLSD